MAEKLVRAPNSGSVASIASTGMTVPSRQRVLDEGLFKAFFKDDVRAMGTALARAKTDVLANDSGWSFGEDIVNTFTLLGDPALELKIPGPRKPTGLTLLYENGMVNVSWDANTESDLAGYEIYRTMTSDSGYVKIHADLLTETSIGDSDTYVGTVHYVVKAVDTSGLSSVFSDEVSLTLALEPEPDPGGTTDGGTTGGGTTGGGTTGGGTTGGTTGGGTTDGGTTGGGTTGGGTTGGGTTGGGTTDGGSTPGEILDDHLGTRGVGSGPGGGCFLTTARF